MTLGRIVSGSSGLQLSPYTFYLSPIFKKLWQKITNKKEKNTLLDWLHSTCDYLVTDLLNMVCDLCIMIVIKHIGHNNSQGAYSF